MTRMTDALLLAAMDAADAERFKYQVVSYAQDGATFYEVVSARCLVTKAQSVETAQQYIRLQAARAFMKVIEEGRDGVV